MKIAPKAAVNNWVNSCFNSFSRLQAPHLQGSLLLSKTTLQVARKAFAQLRAELEKSSKESIRFDQKRVQQMAERRRLLSAKC